MCNLCVLLFVFVLLTVHACHARNVPGNNGLNGSKKEQIMEANAPKAESPKGNGIDDKKHFVYGGVGGFAGVGGYAGVAGGLGGIGKFGGIGGAAGIGGYKGIGGLGG
ncbi:hypothetical protein Golob_025646, partial [Gossypium lobatum]|nr:hypothetical protein [Gossypium lobatum]